jgi:hypothetical protein
MGNDQVYCLLAEGGECKNSKYLIDINEQIDINA